MDTNQLESLQSYLTRIAHHIVRTRYPGFDPEDLLQEMNLYILEKAAQDSTFLEQKPGYVTNAAAWRAKRWCRDQYTSRFTAMDEYDDDDDSRPADEWLLGDASPDQDIAIAVREALATLGERTQKVARMLIEGYQRKEIAAELGIQSPSLSWEYKKIRDALADVYAAL